MLLEELKRRTRPDHDRIEGAMSVTGPDLTRDTYARLLGRIYGFHAPWERRMVSVLDGEWARFFEPRRKARLIEDDLAFLGFEGIDRLPVCEELPELDELPRALGSMYVLEGSTLGGQYIARHLEKALGLSDGRGYAFFRCYGGETGRKWNEFKEALEKESSPEWDETIIRSASETFARMDAWMRADRG